MVLLVCGRHDPPIWVGGWHEVEVSKPDEKSTKADKKACSFRSGHGASGDQNGSEVVLISFLLKKHVNVFSWIHRVLPPSLLLLFWVFVMFCHCSNRIYQDIIDYYCLSLHILLPDVLVIYGLVMTDGF